MYLYYISPYVSIPFLAEGSRLDLKTSNLLEIQHGNIRIISMTRILHWRTKNGCHGNPLKE